MRAALDAISVEKCSRLSSRLSTTCACDIGAVMRRMGSLTKNTVPSGSACTSPVKRSRRARPETAAKTAMGAQPRELVLGHAELFEVVEHLLQSGGDQKIAPRRQRAHEEFEHCGVGHALVEIGLQHRKLIQIGQQRALALAHGARSS